MHKEMINTVLAGKPREVKFFRSATEVRMAKRSGEKSFNEATHRLATKNDLGEEWDVFEEMSRKAIERYAEGVQKEEKPKTYSLENK